MKSSPVFVVGVPRSGTTLLQMVLSRSRQIYTLPETHYFEMILPRLGRRPTEKLAEQELAQAIESAEALMGLTMNGAQQASLVERCQDGTLTGLKLFEYILELYRPANDHARRLRPLEKTPGHVQHLHEIIEMYPAAKVVCIVREPKNAISSLLLTPFIKTRWLVWHTSRWNATVGYVERFKLDHPQAILTARYEDLVSEGEATLGEICHFLGIRFERRMLTGEGPDPGQVVSLTEETWKAAAHGRLLSNRHDAWQDRISREQGWFINSQTRRTRARNGYESDISLTRREIATAQLENWTYLRRHTQESGASLWLLNKCLVLGEVGAARRLSIGLLAGDWRQIRQPEVRAAFWRRSKSR